MPETMGTFLIQTTRDTKEKRMVQGTGRSFQRLLNELNIWGWILKAIKHQEFKSGDLKDYNYIFL